MPFDIKVLEDRIRKLEEVRRMLSDPEIVQLLLESFRSADHVALAPGLPQDSQDAGADEADLVIKEVMKSTTDASPGSESYWPRMKKS